MYYLGIILGVLVLPSSWGALRLAWGAVGGSLPHSAESLGEAQALARMVNIAARYSLLRVRCLEKSLLTEALCLARGIDCELKFGVHNDGRPFTAHAWVEVSGEPLGDSGASDPSLSALA